MKHFIVTINNPDGKHWPGNITTPVAVAELVSREA